MKESAGQQTQVAHGIREAVWRPTNALHAISMLEAEESYIRMLYLTPTPHECSLGPILSRRDFPEMRRVTILDTRAIHIHVRSGYMDPKKWLDTRVLDVCHSFI